MKNKTCMAQKCSWGPGPDSVVSQGATMSQTERTDGRQTKGHGILNVNVGLKEEFY